MTNKIFALPVVEQIAPVLSRRQLDESEVLVVDHPQVKASLALQGAHLLPWKPNGEEEVLWLSNNAPFKIGVALRGGVPICWPWLGPATKQGLSSYGFVRNLPWTLKVYNEGDNGVALTFELQSNTETHQLWPYEFCLLVCSKVGVVCEMELEAHGKLETTSTLHTYFSIDDTIVVRAGGLGDRLTDKVDDAKEDALVGGIRTSPSRTDRAYLNSEAHSVTHDDVLNRSIDVVYHHHLDVVGWDPGSALSASVGDMPDDSYKMFAYIETTYMIAPQKTTEGKPPHLVQIIRVARHQHSSTYHVGCG